MQRIILDPSLFECAGNMNQESQHEHYMFLLRSVEFIRDNCSVTIDLYEGAPYYCIFKPSYIAPPITESRYMKIKYINIKKILMKFLNKDFLGVDIDSIGSCISLGNLSFISNSVCYSYFIKYINLISDKLDDYILILAQNNNITNLNIIDENKNTRLIDTIYDLSYNCDNKVVRLLKESDDSNLIFPNLKSCENLNKYFENLVITVGSKQEKISLMREVGAEFASRNLYHKSIALSSKNSKYIVFEHHNQKYALSVDQEHGGIEVFEKTKKGYNHLGEYNYSGVRTQMPDIKKKTHKLNV